MENMSKFVYKINEIDVHDAYYNNESCSFCEGQGERIFFGGLVKVKCEICHGTGDAHDIDLSLFPLYQTKENKDIKS